jgi:hypothetical protein
MGGDIAARLGIGKANRPAFCPALRSADPDQEDRPVADENAVP